MTRSRRRGPGRPGPGVAGLLFVLAVASACGGRADTVLRVRSELPAELGEALEASFEATHPEVDVRLSTVDGASSAPDRSGVEGRFDVWLGASAIDLTGAAAEGRLEAYAPTWAAAGEGEAPWHLLMRSPFVVAFDRSAVALTDAPVDWIDVFHHGWFEEVGALDPVVSPEARFLLGGMILEALRDDDDLNRGFDWMARLHEQVGLYGSEADPLLRRVADGDLLLAVVPRSAAETARSESPTLHYRIPVSGTPEVLRGVALLPGSDAPEAARAFVDHLGSTEVATAIKRLSHWEPAAAEPDPEALPDDFELEQRWTAHTPALDTLAAEMDGWLERWELEVRPR